MGLDSLYQEFVAYCVEREKTKEIIWVRNPPKYPNLYYKELVWNVTEDLLYIYCETMFGRKETFFKGDIKRQWEKFDNINKDFDEDDWFETYYGGYDEESEDDLYDNQ
jgi:hypothetical protein